MTPLISSGIVPTRKYKVLFVDAYPYRHCQFRVKSNDKNAIVWQRHAQSFEDFKRAITEGPYEIIFIPGCFDNNHKTTVMIDSICAIPEESRPKLVVMHGTEPTVGAKKLAEAGFLLTHIPWDFTKPESHIRNKKQEWL